MSRTHLTASFHDMRYDLILRQIPGLLPGLQRIQNLALVNLFTVGASLAAQRAEVADVFIQSLSAMKINQKFNLNVHESINSRQSPDDAYAAPPCCSSAHCSS